MKFFQFKYSRDNFAYIACSDNQAVAIDGGATGAIISFLKENNITLSAVTNTHSHHDHTCGNQKLITETGADLIPAESLGNMKAIPVGSEKLDIFHTPGHTRDSHVFYASKTLVTGDTLFNGTVGNCFTEDYKSFLKSIKLLMGFPKDTTIYAGHDYVMESITFARTIEPRNAFLDTYQQNYNPSHVKSSLKEELDANIYLRFNKKEITGLLESKNFPVNTEYDRWHSLMQLG